MSSLNLGIGNAVNGTGSFLGVATGEGFATLEWAKSFINKYATWLLALAFLFVFSKAFGFKGRA